MNGDDYNRSTAYVLDIARDLGLGATDGSDAHSLPAVGRCATVFSAAIRDEEDLVRALRSGAYRPVVLLWGDGAKPHERAADHLSRNGMRSP